MPRTTYTATKLITVTATPPFAKDDLSCDPDPAYVDLANTTIVFELDGKTPDGVKFTKFTSDHKEQFGKVVISDNGRRMDVDDLDSKKEKVHYKLHFSNGHGHHFTHDPQIINDPKPI
jgi:hypothetical protein